MVLTFVTFLQNNSCIKNLKNIFLNYLFCGSYCFECCSKNVVPFGAVAGVVIILTNLFFMAEYDDVCNKNVGLFPLILSSMTLELES